MSVEIKDVQRIADLAQIELTPAELERVPKQLNAILAYVEQLNAVPTQGVEPMEHVLSGWGLAAVTDATIREDRPALSLPPEQALAGAPARLNDFFQVPRIVERGERGERG